MKIVRRVSENNPHQPEFTQAVEEVFGSLGALLEQRPELCRGALLERLVEPERVISFRVLWEDDDGALHVNRGYRVQFNGALGPYKGGLRFSPGVDRSVLKFLAFEQTFKNALTGLPMGGGKGGADFDPRGRSDAEVRRFCQSFMTELYRHIGPDTDVPAGDIGVGARELGYLFGQYRRLSNHWHGTLTGKALGWGGSPLRTEATGYGAVYFTEHILDHRGEGLDGRPVVISGSGNVALHCAEALIQRGARVLTLSDSDGFILDKEGLTEDKLAWIKDLKQQRRGRISEYADEYSADGVSFTEGAAPWGVACDWAFPCATQNELDEGAARDLIDNGVQGITEGANMPTTGAAQAALRQAGVVLAPGKAANAGGVAVSGLEMTQNRQRQVWSREKVDEDLHDIMRHIFEQCAEHGEDSDGSLDLVRGANVAGFLRVAEAMQMQGV